MESIDCKKDTITGFCVVYFPISVNVYHTKISQPQKNLKIKMKVSLLVK